jgi:hypothetical protein
MQNFVLHVDNTRLSFRGSDAACRYSREWRNCRDSVKNGAGYKERQWELKTGGRRKVGIEVCEIRAAAHGPRICLLVPLYSILFPSCAISLQGGAAISRIIPAARCGALRVQMFSFFREVFQRSPWSISLVPERFYMTPRF